MKNSKNTDTLTNATMTRVVWEGSGTNGPVDWTAKLTFVNNKFYISGTAKAFNHVHNVNPFEVNGNGDYKGKTDTKYDYWLRIKNWNRTQNQISFNVESWVWVVVAWVAGPKLQVSGSLNSFNNSEDFIAFLTKTGQTYEEVPTV